MRGSVSVSLVGSLCLAAVGAGSVHEGGRLSAVGGQTQRAVSEATSSEYRAVLDRYCVTCHNERLQTGGLALDKLDLSNVGRGGEVWEKVTRKLRLREMPPTGRPRPDEATYDGFASWLERSLDAVAIARPNPGRPALHRLNRTEYANAIRDLLALEIDASAFLPPDDSTYGFDNIADVLGVSPELLESYVTAAQKISRVAVGNPAVSPISKTYRTAADQTQDYHLEGLPFGTRGGMLVRHHFPLDGEYEIRVQLTRSQLRQVRGLQEPHDLEIAVDGSRVQLFTLEGGSHMYAEKTYDGPTPSLTADEGLRIRVPITAGPRVISATFPVMTSALAEDMIKPSSLKSYVTGGMNAVKGLPHVGSIIVTGPYEPRRPEGTPSQRRIFTCYPTTDNDELPCAKEIISAFAHRAYRGAVAEADLQGLLDFYDEGRRTGDFDAGIEMAVWRILSGPRFVFRFESDPEDIAPETVYRITDFELASRLSFFLWSSIPDAQLLDVAASGELRRPAILEREVHRMLADQRSQALVKNFAGQWLSLRKLERTNPDSGRFPDFDNNLRQALRRETELFFDSIMREDRSVLDLLNADYTFVNERLARHYGIPNVLGSRFRRITVPDQRRGLLGHGSILTVTSYPTRTSPVQRGKWVLETLMGSPPPPPPPDVPDLNESEKDETGKVLSMRDRLARHRANAVCANCHNRMDPPGLALEQFDAVGRWRDTPINASGVLPDGTKFDGPAGLREALMRRPNIFVHTMTEKLLTYALGRGLEYYDGPAIRAIMRDSADSNYAFASLIMGVAKSVPFQMQMSAGEDSSTAAPDSTIAAR